jgi:hypothetical protein
MILCYGDVGESIGRGLLLFLPVRESLMKASHRVKYHSLRDASEEIEKFTIGQAVGSGRYQKSGRSFKPNSCLGRQVSIKRLR